MAEKGKYGYDGRDHVTPFAVRGPFLWVGLKGMGRGSGRREGLSLSLLRGDDAGGGFEGRYLRRELWGGEEEEENSTLTSIPNIIIPIESRPDSNTNPNLPSPAPHYQKSKEQSPASCSPPECSAPSQVPWKFSALSSAGTENSGATWLGSRPMKGRFSSGLLVIIFGLGL